MMFELEAAFQEYPWGKKGLESVVAKLLEKGRDDFKIDLDKPYAELWMGTHPNGEAKVKNSGQTLTKWIVEYSNYLGDSVIEKFGIQFPLLFKVLSVAQPLSIQVHPNKQLAKQLHETKPDIYKDDNYKPELAIALTQFQALCGFRPLNEIKKNIQNIPELKEVIGKEQSSNVLESCEANYMTHLKNCFYSLMTCEQKQVETQLNNLVKRLSTLDKNSKQDSEIQDDAQVVLQIASHYPNDVGCFVFYFLNYIVLEPGQAIYLDANVPHAYLKGDVVECMACSDNVIRAGLTPKFKDVDTLCSMLNYQCEPKSLKLLSPIVENQCTNVYKPPVPDFAVAQIKIPVSSQVYTLIPRKTASIIIIISGSGKCTSTSDDINLTEGKIFFVPANAEISLNVIEDLLLFQAFVNV